MQGESKIMRSLNRKNKRKKILTSLSQNSDQCGLSEIR